MRGAKNERPRSAWSAAAAICALIAVLAASAVAATATGPAVAGSASEFSALPSGASTLAGAQDAYFLGLGCAPAGACAAVGYYADSAGDTQAMAASANSGSWGQAVTIAAPANANLDPGHLVAELESASCASPGNCVAGGYYNDDTTNSYDDDQAMVASETNGTWGAASEITLPTGAYVYDPAHPTRLQNAKVWSVSCTSQGNCVATGEYTAYEAATYLEQMPFVASESAGTWSPAIEITTLPSGAGDFTAGEQDAGLYALTCTSLGECVGGGFYEDSTGTDQAMVATESGGVWSSASEVSQPAGAIGEPANSAGPPAAFDAITCSSAGLCVAGGYYYGGVGAYLPMVSTEAGGTWGTAGEVALPDGAANAATDQYSALAALSCPSQGNCEGVGYYTDTNGTDGDYQAFAAQETNGVWGAAGKVALPNGAATAANEQYAALYGVSCSSPGICAAVGGYRDGGLAIDAMTATLLPQLALTTSNLPPATVGRPYQVQLAATGGIGSYSWSLIAGALPAGLSLNTVTGVISGTPTAGGTASVTLAAADPGPPAQQASAPLSIAVAAIHLARASVNAHKHSAKFTFAASDADGAECALVRLHSAKHHRTPSPTYSACGSPKSYKTLRAGRYVFYVEAAGPGGISPPAIHRFAIA